MRKSEIILTVLAFLVLAVMYFYSLPRLKAEDAANCAAIGYEADCKTLLK